MVYSCVGAVRTEQNNTRATPKQATTPYHHSSINYKRAKNNNRGKQNVTVEKRKKGRDYEKTKGEKSDYERRKGKRTTTCNELIEENRERNTEKVTKIIKEEGKETVE